MSSSQESGGSSPPPGAPAPAGRLVWRDLVIFSVAAVLLTLAFVYFERS